MRPHIFPKYRHLVVVGERRFPTRIIEETVATFRTPVGIFSKYSERKLEDSSVRFEGPFSGETGTREEPSLL